MKEIALHILDVAENCVTAGSSRVGINLEKDAMGDLLISIEDDGRGMDKNILDQVRNPFYTTRKTRSVGLGIPLLEQHAEMTGGFLEISSEPGKGTCLKARFVGDHPDRQPIGDLEGVWLMLVSSYGRLNWELGLKTPAGEFTISSLEIKAALKVESIGGRALTEQLGRMIRNNMEALGLT